MQLRKADLMENNYLDYLIKEWKLVSKTLKQFEELKNNNPILKGIKFNWPSLNGFINTILYTTYITKYGNRFVDDSIKDDVGGIHGFCEMLETIYECDFYDEEAVEERENTLGWAQMMGWTGRRIGVKQTL